MFSGVLSKGSFPGRFIFAADAVSLQFLTHSSTVLPLWTLVPMNIEVPTKYPLSHNDRIVVFRNMSPQQKPDALQTGNLWQLKCFESR